MQLNPTTGVYGGIDRSVASNAFWRNQKFQSTVDGTGVGTAATIQNYWNQFIISLTRGTDKPNLVIAGASVYPIFETSLQAIQRITDAKLGSAGFTNLMFQDVPVTFDTLASGLASTTAYFLNTDYLFWRPHADFNMTSLDDKQSVNQDATVKTIVWYGNITTSGARFQGIYSNT